jgi:hypothetical protein
VAIFALFGIVVTVVTRRDPGTLLGVFIVVGTLIGCVTVRARSVRLLIPAPALCYVAAAVIAGAINDRSIDNSHTADLVNASTWIASGFLMMTLATVAAIVFTGLRLFLDVKYRPQPRRYPRPRPVGDDWDATRRQGPVPTDPGQTRPTGQGSPDQTSPIGPPAATGPYRPQGSGPYRSQDTGPYRPQDSGPYQAQDTGAYRSQDTGANRSQDTGANRARGDRPVRRQISGPPRPQISGPQPTQDSGPYRQEGTAPRRTQGSGPYQAQDPYASGPYPEPADLRSRRASGRRCASRRAPLLGPTTGVTPASLTGGHFHDRDR